MLARASVSGVKSEELRELLTPSALSLLDSLEPYSSPQDALERVARLRKAGHSPELVAAVLTQNRLRTKARAKFGEFADRMLFTEAGLEQATRLNVAAVHALRFRQAAVDRVVDLGCGIGADALAFAGAGLAVRAVDADEVTASIASFNLAPHDVEVTHEWAEDVIFDAGEAVWADPARRTVDAHGQSRRIATAADYSPSLEWLLSLSVERNVGIKLGPATDREVLNLTYADQAEAQWVSDRGAVVELTLWTNALARDGVRRSALVLSDAGAFELTGKADQPDAEAGPLGRYIYEPDGAVIRARLVHTIAEKLAAHALTEGMAYVSSDRLIPTPFASAFEVEEVLPLDERKISTVLTQRNIGHLEIKKRGVDIDPATLRKRLKLRGDQSATLIATRLAGRRVAILAQRAS